MCEGIRHSGAPGSLVVSLTISVRHESTWHLTRMFRQPNLLIPWLRRRRAMVSASSHPQSPFVAALVARALATATMSAVLSRPLRARGPACVASDYAPACAPLTHCFTIRARAHTCEHAHTAHAHGHALLGGCKHAAHDVLPWLRARVRETSIALGRFCTWPQPTALCIGADARSRAHVPSPPRPLPDHCHLGAWLPHLPFRLARAVCRGGERADTRRTRCLRSTVLTLTARVPVHQEALLGACVLSHCPIAPAGSWAR